MTKFEKFIKLNSTEKKLTQISKNLHGFIQEFEHLNPLPIKERLILWLENFKTFENIDFSVLISLLEGINSYSDQEVDKEFRTKLIEYNLKNFPNTDLSNIYICPLGNNTESSFRISAKFNSSAPPYFELDINKLLEKIKDNENATIVFVDDILQSGGQLISIFKKYLGIPLEYDDIADEYENRIGIDSANLKSVFKAHKIVVFFYLNIFDGYVKVSKELKALGLNVEIIPINNVIFKGCFGNKHEVESMLQDNPGKYSDLPFKGISYSKVKPIYKILKEVGYLLLKQDRTNKEKNGILKEKWSEEKYMNRALGYGNSAMLFLGQQNVPTTTITALWLPTPENQNTPIEISGRTIIWNPLFYRKSKILSKSIIGQQELEFPKISVIKIFDKPIIRDPLYYDLITLIGLNRRNSVSVIGHDINQKLDLYNHLNSLEIEINSNFKNIPEFKFREWLFCSIETKDPQDYFIKEIYPSLVESSYTSFGIVISFDNLLNIDLQLICKNILNLFQQFPTLFFSILLDCPTRSISLLKEIKSFYKTIPSSLFILQDFTIATVPSSNSVSFFRNNVAYKQIGNFLVYHLSNHPDYIDIRNKLPTANLLEKYLEETKTFNKLDFVFSPKELVLEFEQLLSFNDDLTQNWQRFYYEFLSVVDLYTPEYFDYIVYYAASNSNDIIRFSALKYCIENQLDYSIEYWIAGSECNALMYKNIMEYIHSPINYLLYPIIRYYNRNRHIPGLNSRIQYLLNSCLEGNIHNDYKLAIKVLNVTNLNFFNELGLNDSRVLLKLLAFGLNVFETIKPNIQLSQILSPDIIRKIILSTNMSSIKLNLIKTKYQFLITK